MRRSRTIQPSPVTMQSAQRDEEEPDDPAQSGDDAERAAVTG
jgi:hypothetical protein